MTRKSYFVKVGTARNSSWYSAGQIICGDKKWFLQTKLWKILPFQRVSMSKHIKFTVTVNACLVFYFSVIPLFIWPWMTTFVCMFWNFKQFSRAFSKQYGCASLLHAFERVLINEHSVYARMCRSKNLVRPGNFVILNAFPIFCHFEETYHYRKLGLGQDKFCLLQR